MVRPLVLVLLCLLSTALRAQVLLPDFTTESEARVRAALAAHPRVERAARQVADVEVFDAVRALGLSAVRVGPRQLPDVWDTLTRDARRLGADLAKLELYVTAGDEYSVFSWGHADGRTVIALSTRCLRDLAPAELEFALATEVAHAVANHNLYNNVNRMILALKDAGFRQTYNIADRAVKDIHNYDLTSELFARLLGVPRVVAAMLGIGAASAKAMQLAASWVIESLNREVFRALAAWKVATQTSGNRAALMAVYLEHRAGGLAPDAARAAALDTACRTLVKFMLRDREISERVSVPELIAQAREMIARQKDEAARSADAGAGLAGVKVRFVAWVAQKLKEWIWSRTGYGAMPADLQPRHYLEELVEVVDFMDSAQLAAFLVRVEGPGGILPQDGALHASREAR